MQLVVNLDNCNPVVEGLNDLIVVELHSYQSETFVDNLKNPVLLQQNLVAVLRDKLAVLALQDKLAVVARQDIHVEEAE